MTASAPSTSPTRILAVGRFEVWMLAHGAMGFVGVGGMMFLIPLYVVSQQGTPADAGAVIAVASALALTGPFLGGFADRFSAYRLVQLTSLGLLVLAAVAFAFAEIELTWLVAAALLGLGMAGLSVIDPTFVVAAGFDEAEQANKLAMLQLCVPVGQVLALATVAGLSAAGASFEVMFGVLAAVGLLLTLTVAATNGPAERRLKDHQTPPAPLDIEVRSSLGSSAMSPFGAVIAMAVLITLAGQGIESQYPNYMKSVFDIDPAVSAGALSVMVLVSIPLYPVAGRWAAAKGAHMPFFASALLRASAGVGLLLLPGEAGPIALVVFAVVLVTYPFFEMGSAALVARTSPIGAGAGQGALGAAMALGAMGAAVLAGWLAERFGYPSLALITAVAAGMAAVIGAIFLRRTPQEEKQ